MKKTQPKIPPVDDTFKLHLIETALRKVHEQLENREELKATSADIIRLIEAHNALKEANQPNEVIVRWIEKEQVPPKVSA
jgi:hypothetical protein